MQNEPDHKLAAWLDSYKISDVDPNLLESIMMRAGATPQGKPLQESWFQMGSWFAPAATFAALALVGFWGGVSIPSNVPSLNIVQKAVISDEAYFDKIIFGPQTWKEVSL